MKFRSTTFWLSLTKAALTGGGRRLEACYWVMSVVERSAGNATITTCIVGRRQQTLPVGPIDDRQLSALHLRLPRAGSPSRTARGRTHARLDAEYGPWTTNDWIREPTPPTMWMTVNNGNARDGSWIHAHTRAFTSSAVSRLCRIQKVKASQTLTERCARSWSRCTGAGDYKSSTRR